MEILERAMTPAVAAAAAATLAAAGLVGADLPWLVPVGKDVAAGALPHSIGFAAATSHWHDPLALAQLVVWAVYRLLGDHGLLLLGAAAAAAAFASLAVGARRASTDGGALAVCLLVLLGGASSVLVTRVSLFSLALFPLLLLLLERESGTPSRRIWLAVPLLALWANLHGMVLAGLGLLLAYLTLERARRAPALAAGVGLAGAAAVCATPALAATPLYYRGVFANEAAARGEGLWAPLGTGVFDLLYVVSALVLLVLGARQLRLWEGAAVAVLAAASVHTARTGLWLLFVAAYPAARGLRRVRAPRPALAAVLGLTLAALAILGLLRPRHDPVDALARRAAATQEVVLAEPLAAERVALHGGRVWVANPIDAFREPDQRLYLDWAAGRPAGAAAVARARLVLVSRTSEAGRLAARDRRLRPVAADGAEILYRRKG